jgi:4-amino-4-deoxy-L-arabinose transferase-like glycosyltransferase
MERSPSLVAQRVATRPWSNRLALPFTTLALGVLALVPRVLGLADFVTTDEAYHWITFVERFSGAVAEGRWEGTVLTGHPGIMLWWLGSLGLALERWLTYQGWAALPTPIEHLMWLRLPSAALEALLVPLGYLLLRRIVAPATALIAALLWATSPYLIAHARLLHLDALLASFITFSLLLLLLTTPGTQNHEPRTDRRPLVLGSRFLVLIASGACAGLALLTKGPALILLPFAGLLLFALAPEGGRRAAQNRPEPAIFGLWSMVLGRLRWAVPRYLAWLLAAVAVFVLVWPAMWVAPARALGSFFGEIYWNGGRPNGAGQFFLGQAVGDPGPLFYPVAGLFHMTPALLLGLLVLLLFAVTYGFAGRERRAHGVGRLTLGEETRPLLALGAFLLFWTLFITIAPKKFDRYALPSWPALLVLAAMGWRLLLDAAGRAVARWPGSAPARGAGVRAALVVLLVGLELLPLAQYHPYYLSYYNPLLGGGAAAQRALLIGWGEGLDQVGAYLSGRPDIGYGPVLSALPRTLQPFVPVPVKDVLDIDDGPANYAVIYQEATQLGENPAIYDRIRQTQPLHRVTIHGIDYAEIYQLPRPFERPIGAQFGDALLLRGATVAREPGRLVITPAWDTRARPAADYMLFIHLIDAAGQTVARVDVPPGGDSPTRAWAAGQQIAVPLPVTLPDGLGAGDYRVTLGVYDIATGRRLPVGGVAPADPALDGQDALLLDTVALP